MLNTPSRLDNKWLGGRPLGAASSSAGVQQPLAQVRFIMLSWALTFLVLAIIAGVLGMGVVEGAAANIAWILFVVFIVLFLVGLVTGRRPPVA
jgi:uncharacterized membrane protein YtjA (UPF0391 family)